MSKLTTIKNAVIGTASTAKFLAGKHSPEILLVSGIAAIVGGTVLACKATLRVEEILDTHDAKREDIEAVKEKAEDENNDISYDLKDYQHDKTLLTIQTGVNLLKNYAPSIALMGVGVACIVSSYGIMKKRNVALMAAYNAVDTAFKQYRQRVVDDAGEEKDQFYRYGIEKKKIEMPDENGEVKTQEMVVFDRNQPSQYARYFDESSAWYSRVAGANLMFLRRIEKQANDRLMLNGHLFLNEVYDMLDIPRSPEGQIVGWLRGEGDCFVDFHIYDGARTTSRDFVNGYEKAVLLDFNVQGVIYDKLGQETAVRVF